MNGRRLNWDNAKHDSIKGLLVPTGEDIDPVEEAKLQEWHAEKKGMPSVVEPNERDVDTLDFAYAGGALVHGVLAQVELRERQRRDVLRKIEKAKELDMEGRKARSKGSRRKKKIAA